MDWPPMAAGDVSRPVPPFPPRGGKSAALMRIVDWRATPLGAISAWPQSLKTVIRTILGAEVPMMVAWGPQLTVLYNDAALSLLGPRHPEAMGDPLRRVCADGWTEETEKLIRRAMEGFAIVVGDAVVTGGNGETGRVWHVSPISGDVGGVDGLLLSRGGDDGGGGSLHARDLVTDLRQRLLSDDPGTAANGALKRLCEVVGADLAAYAEVSLERGKYVVLGNWTAGGFRNLRGTYEIAALGDAVAGRLNRGLKAVIGDVATSHLADAERDAFLRAGFASLLSVPVMRGGRWHGFLLLARKTPVPWRDDDASLVEEVGAAIALMRDARAWRRLASDAEARAAERLSLDGICPWSCNEDGKCTDMGDGWQGLAGRPSDDALGHGWVEAIHSQDREIFHAAIRRACDGQAGFSAILRLVHPDGFEQVILRKGVAQFGPDGTLTGWKGIDATVDSTSTPGPSVIGHNEERNDSLVDGRHEEALLRLTIAAGGIGVSRVDIAAGMVTVDDRFKEMFGMTRRASTIPLSDILERIHPDDRAEVERGRAVLREEGRYQTEFRIVTEKGDQHWISCQGEILEDEEGDPVAAIGVSLDTTEQRSVRDELALRNLDLDHRLRNVFTVVDTIIRLVLSQEREPERALVNITTRLNGLARAHAISLRNEGLPALMADVVGEAISPHDVDGRAALSGPPVEILGAAVSSLALIISELAVNALRHGAWSQRRGRVGVEWWVETSEGRVDAFPLLVCQWKEEWQIPLEETAFTEGLGTRLISSAAVHLRGSVERKVSTTGLVVTVTFPLRDELNVSSDPTTDPCRG